MLALALTSILPISPSTSTGISALVAALITSAVSAGILLVINELVRCRFDELRRRVYAPRVERRIVEVRCEEPPYWLPYPEFLEPEALSSASRNAS